VVSDIPKNGNGLQRSIRGEDPSREGGTVKSPSLNPNGNRFWSTEWREMNITREEYTRQIFVDLSSSLEQQHSRAGELQGHVDGMRIAQAKE